MTLPPGPGQAANVRVAVRCRPMSQSEQQRGCGACLEVRVGGMEESGREGSLCCLPFAIRTHRWWLVTLLTLCFLTRRDC